VRKATTQIMCALALIGGTFVARTVQAEDKAFHIEETAVTDAKDGVCNLHTTDHVNAPDHGTVLWFAEANANRLGRLDLKSGKVTKIDLPKVTPPGYVGRSMTFVDQDDSTQGVCDLLVHDGTLWFNYQAANSIGYMETKPPYTIKLLEMPTPKSLPMAFQLGADGNLYVELTAVDKIAKVDPKTHKITEYAVPEKGSGIVGGAGSKKDNAHWFILMNTGKLLRFDYATAKMELFPIPTPKAAPFVIRSYDDGLWFTMFGASAIGHFDPATKTFSTIAMPVPNSAPIGIVMGKDGYLYSDLAAADKIVRIDRSTRTVVGEYPYPTQKSFADEIKQGPDGAIWSPEMMSGKIARLWLPSFGKDPGFPQEKH